ncbi:MAG: gliding motility-associated C-terminal domain-containing protein, partial [Bacteroidetes bacterium]|nr:gliding motility-associated C-terminal domain-containing protein [Bacteroidota bacterium]
HFFPTAGSYPVTLAITTFGGCAGDNSDTALIVTAHPDPIAAFSVNATSFDLPYEATICTNQSVGASTYIWDFGNGTTSTLVDPQHLYTLVGTFPIQLIAITQFGCPDTTYNTITTKSDVVFPNAFTPNADVASGGTYTLFSTNNDVFFPYTAGVIDFNFEIFNRWGEQVFESLDINKGWDGYYKGNLSEQGVYVWKAYIKTNDGKEYFKSGDVTLLR